MLGKNPQGVTNTSAHDCLGLCELKNYKPWFVEECSRFLEEMKQAILQWLQDPSHSNVDN